VQWFLKKKRERLEAFFWVKKFILLKLHLGLTKVLFTFSQQELLRNLNKKRFQTEVFSKVFVSFFSNFFKNFPLKNLSDKNFMFWSTGA